MKKFLKLERGNDWVMMRLDDLFCPREICTSDDQSWSSYTNTRVYRMILEYDKAELIIGSQTLSKKEEVLDFFL